jgi:hypothetical protein
VRVRFFLTLLLAVGLIAGALVLVRCGGEGQQNSQKQPNQPN